jgi:3-oxoacyl-[acyl-carrier protein] reductase
MIEPKIALVTGASRGIGAAIALQLASQGLRVVVSYAQREIEAQAVVAQINGRGGKAVCIQARVDSVPDLDRLFAGVHQAFGRLDVLVNNAGVGGTMPLARLTPEFIEAAFSTNVTGMLLCSQRAAEAFDSDGGSIVNISSALARQPSPLQSVYAATKGAVEAVTRVLAQELGPRKIRVNAVATGPIDTELLALTDEFRAYLNSKTVLGRVGLPDDIAKVVGFLASDAGAWITGEVIGANGGLRV